MARSILNLTPKVDAVDDVMAAHVNTLQTNQEEIWNTLSFVEATELTIDAAGAITVTQNFHTVDTLADAASDNLDTITISGNIEEGTILILRPDHTDRTIVIRHNQDNILCNGSVDITLDDSHDFAFLIYDETLTAWMAFSQWTVLDEDAMGSDSASALATQQSIKKYVDDNAGGAGIGQNFIINGGFRVGQRGTTFDATTSPLNSDDTYLLDRWILLSDGNDIVDVSQETTTIPDGAKASIKLEVETANKQFGILQILENKDAMAFAGMKASLSFQARMAAADDNTHSLKAIVLAWDGAADTVTSDVVNAWLATPTYVANWTGENTPASNTLTTSWQTFTIENISIDTASMANLAVFIFCDQTDGVVDDAIYITGVKLEVGETATDFVPRIITDETELCLRFYTEDWGEATPPLAFFTRYTAPGAVTSIIFTYYYQVPMRVAPTCTVVGVWVVQNCAQPTVNISRVNFLSLYSNSTAAGDTFFYADATTKGFTCTAEL